MKRPSVPCSELVTSSSSDSGTSLQVFAGHFQGNPLPLLAHLERDLAARFRSIRDQRELILEILWVIVCGSRLSVNAMDYLAAQELAEPNPWLRDDIRIAWLTILFAARGQSDPSVEATWKVLGIHPDKLWEAIVARRKAMLGPLYEEFFPTTQPAAEVQARNSSEQKGLNLP